VQFDDAMVRQHGGIGVGLPLTRRLVELHGGKFTLLSTPGHGTTAIIRLPLLAGPDIIPA
jgi:two-component system cell cycle sensor histidine kinase PleC